GGDEAEQHQDGREHAHAFSSRFGGQNTRTEVRASCQFIKAWRNKELRTNTGGTEVSHAKKWRITPLACRQRSRRGPQTARALPRWRAHSTGLASRQSKRATRNREGKSS